MSTTRVVAALVVLGSVFPGSLDAEITAGKGTCEDPWTVNALPLVCPLDLSEAGSLLESSPCVDGDLPLAEAAVRFTAVAGGRHRIIVRPLDDANLTLIVGTDCPANSSECIGGADAYGSGESEVLVVDLEAGASYDVIVGASDLGNVVAPGPVELRVEPLQDPELVVARLQVQNPEDLPAATKALRAIWDTDEDNGWALGEMSRADVGLVAASGVAVDLFEPPASPRPHAPRTALRFDRFRYDLDSTKVELSLRVPGDALVGSREIVVSSGSGDAEILTLAANAAGGDWRGALDLDIGGPGGEDARGDGSVAANPGNLLFGAWQDPLGGGARERSAYAIALIDGRQPEGNLVIEIDPGVEPVTSEVPGPSPDEPGRPLGALADENGVLLMLAANELIIDSADGENDRLLEMTGGTIAREAHIADRDPFRVLRFEPPEVDMETATVILELMGANGNLRVSDERTLGLLVFAAESRLRNLGASPNWVLTPHGQPATSDTEDAFRSVFSDPGRNALQGIQRAWMHTAIFDSEAPVRVAVIDSNFCSVVGTECTVVPGVGFNFNALSSNPFGTVDNFGIGGRYHGSGMATIIGGGLSNGTGVAGVGGQVAELALYNVGGIMFYNHAAAATFMAIDQRAEVINMSFGFPCSFAGMSWCDPFRGGFLCGLLGPILDIAALAAQPFLPFPLPGGPGLCFVVVGFISESNLALRTAVSAALLSNRIVVASSGNRFGPVGPSPVELFEIVPATYPGVITVGVTDAAFRNVEFFGPRVDVWTRDSAPIFGPNPDPAIADCAGSTIGDGGGSSTGAAMVSGVVAMMKAFDPSLRPGRAQSILRSSFTPSPAPANDRNVRRFLNAHRAVITASLRRGGFDPRAFAPSFGFDESDGLLPPGWTSGLGAWVRLPLHPAAETPASAIRIPFADAMSGTHDHRDAAVHDFRRSGRQLEADWFEIEPGGGPCEPFRVTIEIDHPTAGGELDIELPVALGSPPTPERIPVPPLSLARWVFPALALDEPFRFRVGGDDNFYRLRVSLSRGPIVPADSLEVNDSRTTASPIAVSDFARDRDSGFIIRRLDLTPTGRPELAALSIHCRDDQDWFLVELPEDGTEYCSARLAEECNVEFAEGDAANVVVTAGTVETGFFPVEIFRLDGSAYPTDNPGRINCPHANGMSRFYVRVFGRGTLGRYPLDVVYRVAEVESEFEAWFREHAEPALCAEAAANVGAVVATIPVGGGAAGDAARIFTIPRCVTGGLDCDPRVFLLFERADPDSFRRRFRFESPPSDRFEGVLFNGAYEPIALMEQESSAEWGLSVDELPAGQFAVFMRGLVAGSRIELVSGDAEPPEILHHLDPEVRDSDSCGETVIVISVTSPDPVAGFQCEFSFDPSVATVSELTTVGNFASFSVLPRELEPGRFGLGVTDLVSASRVDASTTLDAVAVTLRAVGTGGSTEFCIRDVHGEAPAVYEPIISVGDGGQARSERAATGCVDLALLPDVTAPSLDCPDSPVTATATDPDFAGTIVHFEVGASDDCGSVEVNCVPPSGSVFPVGTTVVVCTAVDAAGNSTECEFEVLVEEEVGVHFRRGDATVNASVDISDPVSVLNFLFLGGPAPRCYSAADGNDDGRLDITDGVAVLGFLFIGAPPPPPPGPTLCGPDPTPDLTFPVCDYDACAP